MILLDDVYSTVDGVTDSFFVMVQQVSTIQKKAPSPSCEHNNAWVVGGAGGRRPERDCTKDNINSYVQFFNFKN
jgi:hypothetical protein